MNKQELIRKYKELWKEHSPFHEPVPYTSMIELFLKELKQLDEPEKVTIPQMVADWIERVGGELFGLNYDGVPSEIYDWVYEEENCKKLHLACAIGYEVEKEKRYTVVMKSTKQPLYYNVPNKKLFFSMGGLATKFTRKQLEDAGFGWVFDCPDVEIEEVGD